MEIVCVIIIEQKNKMSDRRFDFSIGEFYHVYSRGTDRRFIFIDDKDWSRFQKLLFLCNSGKSIVFRDVPVGDTYKYDRGETLVDIGAYCLMSNHFHLLLHEKIGGGISLFMLKLLTAYSSYFNRKHGRSGGLFEGKFMATNADIDEYLKYLISYIHLNPMKIIDPNWKENGIKDREVAKQHLSAYPYSSYLDYVGTDREEGKTLNREAFPEYFESLKEFEQFIDEWLAFSDFKF